HPRRERIVGGDDPVGQCQAAPRRAVARRRDDGRLRIEGREKTRLNRFALLFVISLVENPRDRDLPLLVAREQGVRKAAALRFESFNLLIQLLLLFLLGVGGSLVDLLVRRVDLLFEFFTLRFALVVEQIGGGFEQ